MSHLRPLLAALLLSALTIFTGFSSASANILQRSAHQAFGTHEQVVHVLPEGARVYKLTIQGNIDQTITFNLPARLIATTSVVAGSSHPFNLCLDMGDQTIPMLNPIRGAITLDTNSGCYPAFTQAIDMGSLTFDSSTGIATFQVDPNTASLNVNMFNTSGGIAGGAEEVVAGTMQLRFTTPDNNRTINVQGQINVQGNSSAFNPEQNDVYIATVQGSSS